MIRRKFLLCGVFAVLTGCMQGQLVDTGVASSLRVTEVSVSTRVARKNTAVPKQQILDAVQTKSFSLLSGVSRSGTRPVRVNVHVTQFYIANAAAGILLGSTKSGISAEVSLTDVVTGEVLQEKFLVTGMVDETRATIFGSALIDSPEQEVDSFTDDLAQKIKIAIFGE